MDYNYGEKDERPENSNDAVTGNKVPTDTEYAAPENKSPFSGYRERESFSSGEYRYTPARAEARTDVHERSGAGWSDPVIDKVQDNPGSYYSPNFRSDSPYTSQHVAAPVKEKKPKARLGFGRVLCIILACVLLSSAASGFVAWQVVEHYGIGSSQTKQVVIGSGVSVEEPEKNTIMPVVVNGNELTGEQIYELGKKQVVGVSTEVTTKNYFGMESSSAVTGTGFIISEDGYILTNYHVVEYAVEGGYKLTVMDYEGTEYPAEIIGYESSNDVAVIKIDANGLTPVAFGNSDNIKVGEDVYAIGNPLGELIFTQTAGKISALDRVIATDKYTRINMFQIDAAVNSGNSGGPVYNSKGEVIGIVTAKYSSSGVEGLGFAIPINDAITISTQLIENGYVTGKAFLGVNLQDIESYAIKYYNVPAGAYIYSFAENSCCEKAGVKVGDIVTALDGTEVTSVAELKSLLKLHSAGETVTLTIYRAGEKIDISVTLGEAPANMPSTVPVDGNSQGQSQKQQP